MLDRLWNLVIWLMTYRMQIAIQVQMNLIKLINSQEKK